MIKKTCNGCCAADTGSHPKFGQPYGCLLAYQTDGQGHPAEACPKPKSWKQLKKIEKERAQIMDDTLDRRTTFEVIEKTCEAKDYGH